MIWNDYCRTPVLFILQVLRVTNPGRRSSHLMLAGRGGFQSDPRYLSVAILVWEVACRPKTWDIAFIDNQYITGGAPQAAVLGKVKKCL
jgi:hypothetical protein